MVHLDPRPDTPTADLVKEALLDARELLQAEVELARDELRREIRRAKASAITLGIALGAALIGVALLLVGICLAISRGPLPPLLFGAGFLVLAAIAAVLGYSALPKQPLPATRARLEADARILKEHLV